MTISLYDKLQNCRKRSVPIVVVNTPDQQAFVREATKSFNGTAACVQWDFVRGLTSVNPRGEDALRELQNTQGDIDCVGSPPTALKLALGLPGGNDGEDDQCWSVLFFHNAQRYIDEIAVIQAIANLRDEYEQNNRLLILMGPFVSLPVELSNDVLVFEESFPDVEAATGIVRNVTEGASVELNDETLARSVNAVRGLAAFQIKQLSALHVQKGGMDLDGLWEAKRATIRQTKGLSLVNETLSFNDIGGVQALKDDITSLMTSDNPPTCLVLADEFEKSLAGANDLTGITQDQIGVLLTYLEDRKQCGLLLLGHPGSAKSQVCKSTGVTFGVPVLHLDLGAMMGSLVGQSQQSIRQALKVIDAISGGNALWMATVNSVQRLPPEVQARFNLGTYFHSLPGAEDRKIIWDIQKRLHGLNDDSNSKIDDNGWVGRDIRNCCFKSQKFGLNLLEAAKRITPMYQTCRKEIEEREAFADGKFLDASNPGIYRRVITRESATRSVKL